jgi:hypothetical protein
MSMTRKGFLGAATGGTILLILQACGGGGSDSTPSGSGGQQGMQCGSSGAAISGNHGHALEIPAADLDSTTDMSYSIQGTASHTHTIVLTVAQLQMLKAGQAVTVASSTTLSHNHNVTATCVA